MNTDAPRSSELLRIAEVCTIDEWRRLCCLVEFIDATQLSLDRCVAVAEKHLGRTLRLDEQKPTTEEIET